MRILHSNKIEAKIDPLIGVLIINDDIKTKRETNEITTIRSIASWTSWNRCAPFYSSETTIVFRCVQSCETREGVEK